MNASLNNSMTKLSHICLALILLVLTGSAPAESSVEITQYQPVAQVKVTSSVPAPHTHNTFTHNHIHLDRGVPLAREDVDHIKTAIVPGRTYVPATTPNDIAPSDTTPNNSAPVYTTPVNQQPQYQQQYPQQLVAPQYQQQPQYQFGPSVPQIPTDVNFGGSASPDQAQLKISSRATDPKMQGFLRRTSMQELTSLYHEASRMIDARHVNPPAYEVRMQSAMNNLIRALENDNFLRANNVTPNANLIRQTQSQLSQSLATQTARSATEAVGVMQWSAELVSRQLGIKREAVALEFMNGTIDSLDKYSSFIPEAAAYAPGAELEYRRTAGLEENIVGIGVELETHPMGAILVGVVENSPASGLGLRENDLIVAVNQQSVRGLGLNEVATKIGGPAGTRIELEIERDGQRYRGSLTRRSIYVSSVTGTKMLDPTQRVGYARLKQFSDSSRKDLEAALWSLHNQGMKSFVLDLRGNPGGLLDQAIEVSNLFLPCGTIVSTKGRNASDNTLETATQTQTWSVPLVVLIDKNSASASEIFAAAIQENERGVIVGRQSYGKGTVQTHFPLQTVSGMLKLTTAKFYSPIGREMANSGVTPDVLIQETATGYRGTAADADLNGALATIQQGDPLQLAQQAATCKRTKYQAQGLTINQPNSLGQQLQQNIFGR